MNGELVDKSKGNTFRIRDHIAEIDIRDSLFSSEYNLLINGDLIKGGQEIKAKTWKGLPGWAWIFIVACGAIPVVSLGGCIPAAIGAGGAAGCAAVARNKDISSGLGIVLCIGITMICWVIFVVFIWNLATGTLFGY